MVNTDTCYTEKESYAISPCMDSYFIIFLNIPVAESGQMTVVKIAKSQSYKVIIINKIK